MKQTLTVLLLLLATTMSAERFKILNLSDKAILVDGKPAKKGMEMTDKSVVTWPQTGQRAALSIVSLETGKVYLLPDKMHERKAKTVAEILVSSNKVSTQGPGTQSSELILRERLRNIFAEEYDLFEPIRVACDEDLTRDGKFFVTYEYGEASITKDLMAEGGFVVIDRSLFLVDGQKLEPRDVELNIFYQINGETRPIVAKGWVKINLYPMPLEE